MLKKQSFERLRYLFRSAQLSLRGLGQECPNCGCRKFARIKRKYFVTALVRCAMCRILYRVPVDPVDTTSFYQVSYTSGMTTECPGPGELKKLLDSGFRGTAKDFTSRIELLGVLGVTPGQRVLDYGASWGYGTWQFRKAGFDAIGYEISQPRAEYARKMVQAPVYDQLDQIEGPFDAILSCHVLEHVPRPTQTLEWCASKLRPGGLLVTITPNGAMECMAVAPARYHRAWGQVHPFYIDPEYYRATFPDRAALFSSFPFDHPGIHGWNRTTNLTLNLSGAELLCTLVF